MHLRNWFSKATGFFQLNYSFLIPLIVCSEGAQVIARQKGPVINLVYLITAIFFGFGITALLRVLISRLIKKSDKQAFLFFLTTLCVFFFQSFYNLFERTLVYWMEFDGDSLFINLIFWLVFCSSFILMAVLINRISVSFKSVNRYLFFALLSFTVLDVFFLVTRLNNRNDIELSNPPAPVTFLKLTEQEKANLPDIYYIIVDAYTSSKSLLRFFGRKNELDSFYRSKNIFIATDSKSNYPVTYPSLAASLNMSYLAAGNDSRIGFYGRESLKSKIRNSIVFKFLKENGYRSVYLSHIFEQTESVSRIKEDPEALSYTAFYKKAVFYSIIQTGVDPWFLKDNNSTPPVLNYPGYSHFIHNNSIYNALMEEAAKVQDSNKVVYAHLMNTHSPFVFNRKGGYKNLYYFPVTKTDYLEQVDEINRKLMNLVTALLTSGKKNKIIIIQADHGSHLFGTRFYGEEEMYTIQNAYYFPDQNYELLYPGISPVNTFRVVLNQYFDCKLPMLADSSYNLNY